MQLGASEGKAQAAGRVLSLARPRRDDEGDLRWSPTARPGACDDSKGLPPAAWPQALPKNNKAPEPCGSGAKLGGGRSPRTLPSRTHWALSLSRAVCSPTPLFAACEDFDLMAGSLRPLPAGVYRVRPLRPVRPLLASGGHAGRGADTPATCVASRRHRYHGDGAGFWPVVGPVLRV